MKFDRNNVSLSFGDAQYFVQPENGVVVCKLPYVINVPRDFGDSLIPIDGGYYWDLLSVGIARCTEGDTFDEEIGRKVALAKAEQKAYVATAKKISDAIKVLDFAKTISEDFLDKATRTVEHNTKYIKRITD